MIEERLLELIRAALAAAAGELGIEGDLPEPELSPPKQKEHGDFATNVALVAGRARRPDAARGRAGDRATASRAPFVETRRGRRPGVPQHLRDRRLAARRPPRRGRGAARRYGAGPSPTAAGPGRVREREPDRARSTIGHARNAAHRRCARAAARGAGLDASSASTTSTTPAGRWTGSARRSRRATCSCSGATPSCPRTAITAPTSPSSPRDILEPRRSTHSPTSREPSASRGCCDEGAERILAGIKATARTVRRAVRRLPVRARAADAGRDRRTRRAAARRRATSTTPTARCGSGRRRSATTRIGW